MAKEDSKVVKVIPHENLTLSLWFKKNPAQEYFLNFKVLIDENKFFEPLNNVDLFMQAHIMGESIGWNDLLDIGAEWLYMDSDPVNHSNQ